MISGLYAAATGMIAVEHRQAVIANNISNAATPGFKRQLPVDKGFYQLLFQRMRHPFWANRVTGPGGGLQINETFTDHAMGPLMQTGNPLDIALQGPGFIVVNTPAGERLTRNGHLAVDADGRLMTVDGHQVQDINGGGIDAVGGPIMINRDGTVLVDGAPVGRIRIVEFDNPHMLNREGHDMYRPTAAAMEQSIPAADTDVISESLESANVQLPTEMINMILGVRSYEANQRVINSVDETIGRLIDQVGMPL